MQFKTCEFCEFTHSFKTYQRATCSLHVNSEVLIERYTKGLGTLNYCVITCKKSPYREFVFLKQQTNDIVFKTRPILCKIKGLNRERLRSRAISSTILLNSAFMFCVVNSCDSKNKIEIVDRYCQHF